MIRMSTQFSRKPGSEEAGPKAAHVTPSLSHACHLPAYTGCAAQVLGARLGDITQISRPPSRAKLKYFEKFSTTAVLTGFTSCGAEVGTQGSRQLMAQSGELGLILCK